MEKKMFGYVRPNKGELLVREFTRFRAVYCGICKEIGRSYGQIPRVALTYDITMMGLLMISLSQDAPEEKMDRCILNPLNKRPMLANHEILHRCAALSVLLAYGKFSDEIQDGRPVVGNFGKLLLKKASRKASKEYPDEASAIMEGLKKSRETELAGMKAAKTTTGRNSSTTDKISMTAHLNTIREDCRETDRTGIKPDWETAAAQFGDILQAVFKESFCSFFAEEKFKDSLLAGIASLGSHLGRWIFILDAIDDYEQDHKMKNWNPFMNLPEETARETALELLLDSEKQMDQIAALLPYKRDANIISNILQEGLPFIRQKVFLHQKLGRL